jgi:UDP-glucuronate 4-epimerase
MILITGAAGFIGSHLANLLVEQGLAVIGCDNFSPSYGTDITQKRLEYFLQPNQITCIYCDLTNKEQIDDLFQQYSFHTVIHLAAQPGVRFSMEHPISCVQNNILAFVNLLEACRAKKVQHVIYASSSSVYGEAETTAFAETNETSKPVSLYAASKKADELIAYSYAHLYDMAFTGLRFFTVYGPWGRPDMACYKFTQSIFANKPLTVYANGMLYRDFTYISDIVAGILQIILSFNKDKTDNYRIYNIGNSNPVKLLDFINILEACCGKKAVLVEAEKPLCDVSFTCANTDRMQQDFNWAPHVSIEQGIPLFVDWYKKYTQML